MSLRHPYATTSPYHELSDPDLAGVQQQATGFLASLDDPAVQQQYGITATDSPALRQQKAGGGNLPPGYRINDQGKVEFYGDKGLGPVLTYAPYALGAYTGITAAASALGSGAGTAAATSAAAPSAAGSSVAGTAAAGSVLPSSVIGTGEIAPIVGGTSGAGMGGGGMGFLDLLKTGYDAYKKGKQVYDAGRQVYDTVKGPSEGNGPSAASAVGQTAGSIEAGRAKGLIDQATLQQRQDQLGQSRATLALNAPSLEARNSVQGDILANAQDANFSGLPDYIHIGQTSGGLRPSMLSASSRALGANMSRNALANNLSGADVPALTPLPHATGLDTALQGVAGAGSFLDALSRHGGATSATPAPTDPGGPAFGGPGSPGYPGDATSPANDPVPPPMPPIASQAPNPEDESAGIDPAILEWLRQSAQPGANA